MYLYPASEILKHSETSTTSATLLKSGIIHVYIKPDAVIGKEEQLQNFNALKNIAVNSKHPLIIDSDDSATYTPEGRQAVKELELNAPISARAFVTNSLAHRLMINFYKAFYKTQLPLKVFTDYALAEEWAKKYLD
jgi:hypothetical protein